MFTSGDHEPPKVNKGKTWENENWSVTILRNPLKQMVVDGMAALVMAAHTVDLFGDWPIAPPKLSVRYIITSKCHWL